MVLGKYKIKRKSFVFGPESEEVHGHPYISGNTFHHAVVSVSFACGFSVLAVSFIVARPLMARGHFIKGSAGTCSTSYPGGIWGLFSISWKGRFSYQSVMVLNATRIYHLQVLEEEFMQSWEQLSLFFIFWFVWWYLLWFDCRQQTSGKTFCECPMNQWKAHLHLVFQVKSWKKVVSSTGFPSGNGMISRSCNHIHQRQLLFWWWDIRWTTKLD